MTAQAFQWGQQDQSRHLNGSAVAAAVTLSTQFGLIVSGSTVGSPLVSTGALTAGSATCTFPTATLTVGAVLMIASSTQLYMDGVSGAIEKRGEMVEVESITDSAHFEAAEPLRFSYSSGATTTAQKLDLLDRPVIDLLDLTMGGTGKVHNGVLFDLCRNPVIRNFKGDGCEDTIVQFTRCWGGTVEYCTLKNATSPDPGVGTTGYGVAVLDGSRDINVGPGNTFENCRHAVAGGGTPPPLDVRVFGNTLIDCGVGSGASLDCHEATFGWEFYDNTIKGARNIGILLRGQRSKARNNKILYPASHGVLVKSFDTNTGGLNGCEVIDNEIVGSGGANVRLEGTTACPVNKPRVRGNTGAGAGLNNLTMILAFDVKATDNAWDAPLGSGNDGRNIRIVGTSTSDRCERIKIITDVGSNSAIRPITADFTSELLIDTNWFEGASNSLMTSCLRAYTYGRRNSFTVASLPAAATFSPTHGVNNIFRVSLGTGTIDTIVATDFQGQEITLVFDVGGITVSEAGNINLDTALGAFSSTANDLLRLASTDGANWREIERKAN